MMISLKLFQIGFSSCFFSFILDIYSIIFSFSVILISCSVMFYSWGYMMSEFNKSRFYKLVLGFVLSMLLLVFSSNMFTLMIGWDGLGILSFFLVVFYQNESSLGSGLITMFSNRVGDSFLLILMGLMGMNMNWTFINSFSFLMLVILMSGSITKSAQIPFSSWLPRAMAAPTPISALVHSSTLVTAGVFLMIRFSSNLNYNFIFVLGACTALLAGLTGMTEHDLKKVIALSTLSQLGVMFMSLGLNLPNVAFFHLCTHAFFKAMIFICAGEMITTMQMSQDIRLYGNVMSMNPIVSMFMLSGSLALSGLPFMAGFYSKDAMLENFMKSDMNSFICLIGWLGVFMTTYYSFRLIILSVWSVSMNTSLFFNKNLMTIFPLFLLNLGAISSGSILSYFLYFSPFFSSSLVKLLPFIILLISLTLSLNYCFTEFKKNILSSLGYLNFITENLNNSQKSSYKIILINESGWLEMIPSSVMSLTSHFKLMNLFIGMLSLIFILVI